MANKGLGMYKIHQILELHNSGKSYREISSSLGLSRKSVTKYVLLYQSTGLAYSELEHHSEAELAALFKQQEEPHGERFLQLSSMFPYFESELKRVGVTKQLLWSEYKINHPDGYNYTQFCHHLNCWLQTSEVTMCFEHKPGDKMFIDFAGKKMSYFDTSIGKTIVCEVFVAILGASQLTYIEAIPNQQVDQFIKAVENALRYFGGVPAAIVPDNLKSAVIKSDKYEAELNEKFADFAEHYNTVILPTRSRKPRDKALVEGAVRILYTNVYAPLRDIVFNSISELNQAMHEQLAIHNDKKLTNRTYSRQEYFDSYEKSELRLLPSTDFEIKNHSIAKVQKNSHIWFGVDKNYYSVPYRYIGKMVKIAYTTNYLAMYYDYERIAYHVRSYSERRYNTIQEHLPSSHQFVSQWNDNYFKDWASKIGTDTEKVITEIINASKHPEQAYKSCVGVLGYAKKLGNERLNNACKRADKYQTYSYRSIKNILEKNLDKLEEQIEIDYKTPSHDNIRGANYYATNSLYAIIPSIYAVIIQFIYSLNIK